MCLANTFTVGMALLRDGFNTAKTARRHCKCFVIFILSENMNNASKLGIHIYAKACNRTKRSMANMYTYSVSIQLDLSV